MSSLSVTTPNICAQSDVPGSFSNLNKVGVSRGANNCTW
jgi:hypothetical protein